ncbi:hypothetical protein B0H13DRAFT_2655074 [Mycena leptocephala]|nr:hypothetical protein B0H13DRAFT_2655074 [Mycena leptocephala]
MDSTAHLALPSAPFIRPCSPANSTHFLTVNYLPSKFSHTLVSRRRGYDSKDGPGMVPRGGGVAAFCADAARTSTSDTSARAPARTGLLRRLQRHLRLVHRRALGLDYAPHMAHSNFSGAMFHWDGQNVFYNVSLSILRLRVLPFLSFVALLLSRTTAIHLPPTNESQWSVGSLYYSALVMAEAIDPSNQTQVQNYWVADLTSFSPTYGSIDNNGVPVRAVIFNYVDNPSGANTVYAVIRIAGATEAAGGGGATPARTFGGNFESDGRPTGTLDIKTVQCDTLHFDGPSADLDRGWPRLAEVGRGGSTALVEGKLAEVG